MSQPETPDQPHTTIVFADAEMVEIYEKEVDEVVNALLGHERAFVSDLSSVWDFSPSSDEMSRLETLMGRSVGDEGALLWELGRELRLKRTDEGLQPPRTMH